MKGNLFATKIGLCRVSGDLIETESGICMLGNEVGFVTEDRLCRTLHVSRQTARRLFRKGEWPKRTWISSRRWIYRIGDVEGWVEDLKNKGTLGDLVRGR